jgi:hypothetical protein
VFLIDLKRDPVDAQPLADEIPQLLRRIRRLKPEKIIVIKASVFDLVRDPLISAGLSLIDERVPFPGSGQQRRFVAAFLRALKRAPAGPGDRLPVRSTLTDETICLTPPGLCRRSRRSHPREAVA